MQAVSVSLSFIAELSETYILVKLRELVDLGCHTFEAACFGNLQPANADEAKRLIP